MTEPFNNRFDNIIINGSADYILRIRYILTLVQNRQAGREILIELKRYNAQITITPNLEDRRAITVRTLTRNSVIYYNSTPWSNRIIPAGGFSFFAREWSGTHLVGPAWTSDSVLCHELCHCVRNASGYVGRIPPLPGIADTEEFFAVHVTNVYLSERGEALKASYDNDERILNPSTSTFLDFPSNRTIFERIVYQHPHFAHRLALIRTNFNPFSQIISGY